MGQYGICVCAYPVVCARDFVFCTRMCVSVHEGDVIVCIEQEVIRNYEWYGSPVLPGMYNSTDAEGKYLFRDDDVPHNGSYRLVSVLCIMHVVVIDHECGLEEFPGDLSVSIFRSYGPYDSWVRERGS